MGEGREERMRRRSARLSALEAGGRAPEQVVIQDNEDIQKEDLGGNSSTTPKKRGRKRKLRSVEQVANTSLEQESETSKLQNHSPNNETPHVTTCETSTAAVEVSSEMPEKQYLKLIIDILQRRDTKGLFAEPVDPVEVEDYYKVIKEPMDFSTMREKLDQGFYKSLDQFKRDVYLIPCNAMHFNASSTIFFRQASAIQLLAKKVFLTLREDPKKLELKFPVTRGRPGRKPKGESRTTEMPSPAKVGNDMKRDRVNVKGTPRGRPRSLYRLSNSGSSQAYLGSSSPSPRDRRSYESYHGSVEDGKFDFSEAGRRSTYRRQDSFHNENESFMSEVYNTAKPLLLVNGGGVSYEESLKMFAKDLGPAVQMVVKRKLEKCEAAGRSNNSVPEQPRELSLTNDVPTCKRTCVGDAVVPVHRKTDGGGGMEENRGERNPPTLVGRSEMPIDHEASINKASAASSGNNFLAMMMDSCISDTPLSRPVEFESPLATMSNNNTSQSSLGLQVQDMLKNRRPNNSCSSDSMLAPPNSILEKSKTGPIGVSPLMGLAEQKNSTATGPSSSYTDTHLGSQLSGAGNQTTSVVGVTCIQPNTALQSQRCTPYPLNPPNLLSSQTFGRENQSNFLTGGSSSYWPWDKPAIGPVRIEPTLGALQSYYGSGGSNQSRITPGGQAMVGWNQNHYSSNAHPLVGYRQNQMSLSSQAADLIHQRNLNALHLTAAGYGNGSVSTTAQENLGWGSRYYGDNRQSVISAAEVRSGMSWNQGQQQPHSLYDIPFLLQNRGMSQNEMRSLSSSLWGNRNGLMQQQQQQAQGGQPGRVQQLGSAPHVDEELSIGYERVPSRNNHQPGLENNQQQDQPDLDLQL